MLFHSALNCCFVRASIYSVPAANQWQQKLPIRKSVEGWVSLILGAAVKIERDCKIYDKEDLIILEKSLL